MQESGAHVLIDAHAAAMTVPVRIVRIMLTMRARMPMPAASAIAMAVSMIMFVMVAITTMPLAMSTEFNVAGTVCSAQRIMGEEIGFARRFYERRCFCTVAMRATIVGMPLE